MIKLRFVLAFILGLTGWAAPAAAQIGIGGFTISPSATVTSDYRFRGVSQSGRDPAVQASLEAGFPNGLYAGVFASSLADRGRPGGLELAGYVGYAREVTSGTDVDLGVQLYTFPDNDGPGGATYVEPYAALRHTLGPVRAEVGAAYAPRQDAFGGDDSLYVYGDVRAGIPLTPLSITGRVGYTSGPARFTGLADYAHWQAGLEYAWGPAQVGLQYVDTDLPSGTDGEAGVVASVRVGF